jgi:hypothetical protein
MKLAEHNAAFGAKRRPDEIVLCNTMGYGEISQYDSRCSWCWLGHDHRWATHDQSINTFCACEADHAGK